MILQNKKMEDITKKIPTGVWLVFERNQNPRDVTKINTLLFQPTIERIG